jgi:hypothetical protein
MGPDRRIADYISANRAKYTREAITQQLLESGYEREAIDATWTVLDTPDPDDVVGERFWSRFWIYLIGLNVVAFLLVSLATTMIPNGTGLAAVLGIALAIGALISLGIVAVTRPARLGRGAAIAIGGIVPLIFTFFIAGSCYALVQSFGGIAPPPMSGTITVRIDPPMSLEATGDASCQPPPRGETYFNVYTTAPISSSEGPLNVYIYASANTSGGELVPTASISFGDPAGGAVADYMPVSDPNAGIELEPGSTVTSGSLTFEGFLPAEAFDEQGNPIDRSDADPISGTISWSCDS